MAGASPKIMLIEIFRVFYIQVQTVFQQHIQLIDEIKCKKSDKFFGFECP